MNTSIKAGVAVAMALGGVAAHASIASTQSGSSDAILFAEVVNAAGTAAVASYAGDTGVSVNSILAGLSSTGTTVLGSDANLAKLFAADAAGDTVYFAVLGGQYPASVTNPTAKNFEKPGVAQFLSTTSTNDTSALGQLTPVGLSNLVASLNATISGLNSNSGGANSIEGSTPATTGIWDVTNTSGVAYWGGGSVPNGVTGGTTANLYYVTAGAGGTTSTPVSTVIDATASLSANGLVLSGVGGTTTTPLPAAVWLLGSGLLGLTGVARRKLKV